MANHLKEIERLAERLNDDEAHEHIRTGIQALMFHQVVYEDTHGLPKASFNIIKDNLDVFQTYFRAAGFTLSYNAQTQMIALEMDVFDKPHYAFRQIKLRKDETLVRLVLRYLFEMSMTDGSMTKSGRAKTDTGKIIEQYEKISGGSAPTERVLVDQILRDLARVGAVRIGDRIKDTRISEITILPGIRVHISDRHVAEIKQTILGESIAKKTEK